VIFRPELVKLINQRKKTMTRRIATTKTCRYRPGHVYRVQPGRGKRGVCSITISDVRLEALGLLTLRDANREGFRTRQDFMDYWAGLYGKFDVDIPVWVISFQLGEMVDVPLLLAATPGAPHGDYVHQSFLAMAGEPEALTQFQTAPYVVQARARDLGRAGGKLQVSRDNIAAELADMRAHLVDEPDRDIARTVRALEHQLASLDRKLRSAA
jgi:uncharacterized protein YqfB (UPF0267 family)